MAQIANLHSILSGKWFLHPETQNALLPYLNAILNHTPLPSMEQSENHYYDIAANTYNVEGQQSAEPKEGVVAVIDLKNPILKYDQECGPKGTQSTMSIMRTMESDSRIVGVVLDIDSGGGQVAGTPEFAAFIKNYKKPVVIFSAGMVCSAAYYIGAGADEIIVSEYADCVGSIGTMLAYVNMKPYYEKIGAQVIEAYATKSKKKNKAIRVAESKGDFSLLITEELDPINEKFHAAMKQYRPQLNDIVFAGAHYNDLDQAKSYGLFDSFGTLNMAIERVIDLSKQ